MKITRDAFDLATAAANDSEVPLWLVGDRGIITEILVAPPGENDSLSYYFFGRWEPVSPGLIPVGMHYYGKVITRCDKCLVPGCNLLERDGEWHFADEDGCEMPLDIVEP